MRAVLSRIAVFVLALIGTASAALAWESATHAYIETRLNNKGPLLKLNQIYGGMGTDAFNYMFEQPNEMAYLTIATHCQPLPVWRLALLPTAKAEAFGFVSHNNLWGADFYAHEPGCPANTPPLSGYIFDKGAELQIAVESDPTYGPALVGLGLPTELEAEIFRELAEFSVDILVKRRDPAIGQKVATSALLRSPEFPLLLVLAYSRGLAASTGLSNQEAARMIRAEEAEFRLRTIAYGQVLTLDDSSAILQVSEQMAQLAQTLLALNGVTPVPPPEALVPLINFAIGQGVILCEPDFAANIDLTITNVKTNLAAHGISY